MLGFRTRSIPAAETHSMEQFVAGSVRRGEFANLRMACEQQQIATPEHDERACFKPCVHLHLFAERGMATASGQHTT